MQHLYAAKGRKVVHVDLRKAKPSKAELTKLMIGPSGNLRAPTLRVGKTFVVGFNDEMYDTVLG
jgi:hypothetical protein